MRGTISGERNATFSVLLTVKAGKPALRMLMQRRSPDRRYETLCVPCSAPNEGRDGAQLHMSTNTVNGESSWLMFDLKCTNVTLFSYVRAKAENFRIYPKTISGFIFFGKNM